MILRSIYFNTNCYRLTHTGEKCLGLYFAYKDGLSEFRDTDVHGIWVRLRLDMPVRRMQPSRTLAEKHQQKEPPANTQPVEAAHGLQPLHCFPACREKTSVNYLNGTLYWRSSELVSSLFNFRKWCHNALNNNTGWFIFPWTCCPSIPLLLQCFQLTVFGVFFPFQWFWGVGAGDWGWEER